MLDVIFNMLSPKIEVYVAPDVFTFSGAAKTLSLRTTLYVKHVDGEFKILGVGESFQGAESCETVDLFEPPRAELRTLDRFGCLEAFFRFAFVKIADRRVMVMIRPTVVIHGAHSLSSRVAGYEKPILNMAAESAGALSVKFKD